METIIDLDHSPKIVLTLPKEEKKGFLSHIFVHWIQGPIFGGGAIVTGMTIFEYVKKRFLEAGFLTAPSLALWISFFALIYFIPKKKREEAMELVRHKQEEVNEALNMINKETKQFDINIKKLFEFISDQNKNSEELKLDFKQKSEVLEKVIEELQKLKKEKQLLEKMYQDIEEQSVNFFKNAQEIQLQNEKLNQENQKLGENVKGLKHVSDNFIGEVSELDEKNKQFDFQNGRLVNILKQINDNMHILQEYYEKIKKENEELKQKVESLSTIDKNIGYISNEQNEQLKLQEQQLKKLENLVKDLKDDEDN